jgi:hypothetical protein
LTWSGYVAIGSAVLLVPKDESGYVSIINLLPVPVSVKRGQRVAWCSLAQNAELYIPVKTYESGSRDAL